MYCVRSTFIIDLLIYTSFYVKMFVTSTSLSRNAILQYSTYTHVILKPYKQNPVSKHRHR